MRLDIDSKIPGIVSYTYKKGGENMQLSDIIIKIVGIVLLIVGLGLILSMLGLQVIPVSLQPWWLATIVGVVLLGAGIYIIRGGTINL